MEFVKGNDHRLHVLSLRAELKSTVCTVGKRKETDTLSDGPVCKRPAPLSTHFVVSISLFPSGHAVGPFLG